MKLTLYSDGGSRGNPGISGCGFALYDGNEKVLRKESIFLGTKTNNEAEYIGLLRGLEYIVANYKNFDELTVVMDSELIVKQMIGVYKIKAENLKPLFTQIIDIKRKIGCPIRFVHKKREFNSQADKLANMAMDSHSNGGWDE